MWRDTFLCSMGTVYPESGLVAFIFSASNFIRGGLSASPCTPVPSVVSADVGLVEGGGLQLLQLRTAIALYRC
jgi:hypothetical protein